MTRSRKLMAALLLGLPLLAAACSEGPNLPAGPASATGSASSVSNPGAVVTLQYSSFEPSIVTITAGQTVEWEWEDSPIPHDVSFQDFFAVGSSSSAPVPLSYHSPIMLTGTWFHTFTQPGTYYYICTVHAAMFGRVIVTAANGTPSSG